LSLRRLRKSPHGIDLGPLAPCLPGRLQTPSKRIQLAPGVLRDDLRRLEARFPLSDGRAASAGSELLLIGRRHLPSNKAWMPSRQRLVKGKERCTLLMRPGDGASRGLVAGQTVRVTSRVGSIEAPVELSEEMMPGVISLPHGWGHTRQGLRLQTAAQ